MAKYHLDYGGLGVDSAVRKYMKENPGSDYCAALRAIIKRYSTANSAEHTWSNYTQDEAREADTPNIARLRDVVLSCPLASDGAPDPQIAAEIVTGQFMELGRCAAGDWLSRAARRDMTTEYSASDALTRRASSAAFDKALRKISEAYPEIFEAYSKGVMSVTALKEILRRDQKSNATPKTYAALKRYG